MLETIGDEGNITCVLNVKNVARARTLRGVTHNLSCRSLNPARGTPIGSEGNTRRNTDEENVSRFDHIDVLVHVISGTNTGAISGLQGCCTITGIRQPSSTRSGYAGNGCPDLRGMAKGRRRNIYGARTHFKQGNHANNNINSERENYTSQSALIGHCALNMESIPECRKTCIRSSRRITLLAITI